MCSAADGWRIVHWPRRCNALTRGWFSWWELQNLARQQRDILRRAGFPTPEITSSRRLPTWAWRRSSHPCSVSRSLLNHLNTFLPAKPYSSHSQPCPSWGLGLSLKWSSNREFFNLVYIWWRASNKEDMSHWRASPLLWLTELEGKCPSLSKLVILHTTKMAPSNRTSRDAHLFLELPTTPSPWRSEQNDSHLCPGFLSHHSLSTPPRGSQHSAPSTDSLDSPRHSSHASERCFILLWEMPCVVPGGYIFI